MLGVQVLLGFQYRAFFEPAFDRLPRFNQHSKLAGLVLLLAVIGLIMLPASRHRLVERGEDTSALHRFTLDVVGLALLPFAAALALDLYDVGWTRGPRWALALGAATFALALAFWYGIALGSGTARRARRKEAR